MKSRIYAILALVFFVVAMFWIIPILRDRYFSESVDSATQENVTPVDSGTAEEVLDAKGSLDEKAINKENYFEVKNEDCANQCENFKNDAKNLEYCQEYCGFSLIESQKSK